MHASGTGYYSPLGQLVWEQNKGKDSMTGLEVEYDLGYDEENSKSGSTTPKPTASTAAGKSGEKIKTKAGKGNNSNNRNNNNNNNNSKRSRAASQSELELGGVPPPIDEVHDFSFNGDVDK